MIQGKHQSLDFKVTPNHKMVVRKFISSTNKLSDNYSFVDADKLGWWVGLKTQFFHCRENNLKIVFPEEKGDNGVLLPELTFSLSDWV